MSSPEFPFSLPPLFRGVLTDLLNCVCAGVRDAGAGPVCWCGYYPGATASWEHCGPGQCDGDACGMVYIRPDVAFPYNSFPNPIVDISCQAGIAYRFEVGILRCMPVGGRDGAPPSVDDLTEVTLGLVADQWAIHQAIRCCDWATSDRKPLIAMDAWRPVGPLACVGGYWGVFVDPNG